jgi:hypothetical protein
LIGFEADYDDMASPHRSESFQDGSASPSVLLVPTGDGDFFEMVLGPVFTLVRSDEASPEQESPLAVEPADDEPALIEGEPSRVSISLDGQPLMITDGVFSPEFSHGRAEDLTEQAAADYELDEGGLEEQLLNSPDAEAQTSESPAEAPAYPGISHFFCRLLETCFVVYLPLCFVLQSNLVCLRVLLRQLMCLFPPQSCRSRVTRRQVESLLYLFLL